jgi:hypothetical protein
MSQLHKALEALSPKDYGDVPLDDLQSFLTNLFSNAELIANSVPPPPGGAPYESARRTRTDVNSATSAADLTVSNVRRPPPAKEHAELQKAWGKPLKLGGKDAATGISVFKMAGNDRHGAWFARTSVHEGLGFDKWKRSMIREFPESLEVDGGPGVGSVRGIGGDRRLEDIHVDGLGKLAGTTSCAGSPMEWNADKPQYTSSQLNSPVPLRLENSSLSSLRPTMAWARPPRLATRSRDTT